MLSLRKRIEDLFQNKMDGTFFEYNSRESSFEKVSENCLKRVLGGKKEKYVAIGKLLGRAHCNKRILIRQIPGGTMR
ncbi:hypothetical protein SDC9_41276 [bioreactor metagenome]|jgi:hypothetical protein|uniref:Uncharacterized protein n=1 Tax=bioreactor metagenome TaxID=1076179 RepID=A0A644VXA5_9ZZZZ